MCTPSGNSEFCFPSENKTHYFPLEYTLSVYYSFKYMCTIWKQDRKYFFDEKAIHSFSGSGSQQTFYYRILKRVGLNLAYLGFSIINLAITTWKRG